MTTTTYIIIAGVIILGLIVLFVSRSRPASSAMNQPFMPAANNSEVLNPEILRLVQQGRKIQAIKLVREQTGWGLKESKDYVDALEKGGNPTFPQQPQNRSLPPDIEYKVRDLVQRGQPILAIKLVREQTGWGLKEAKDYVDRL